MHWYMGMHENGIPQNRMGYLYSPHCIIKSSCIGGMHHFQTHPHTHIHHLHCITLHHVKLHTLYIYVYVYVYAYIYIYIIIIYYILSYNHQIPWLISPSHFLTSKLCGAGFSNPFAHNLIHPHIDVSEHGAIPGIAIIWPFSTEDDDKPW